MSYWIITNSRGQEVANVADGTINTTGTSLTLIGKNYAYYGQPQNENYVYMLENFAKGYAPANPVPGQLWFNTDSNTLSVYTTGESWTAVATAGSGLLGTMASQNANAVSIIGGSITGISPLAISSGGTGANTATDARTNLGLGSMATQNSTSVDITGGSIVGIADLAVSDGGTGASTAAGARTNLGLGSLSIQNSNYISVTGGVITGINPLPIASGGTGAGTASDARNNLGLGSMAVQSAGAVSVTGGTITGITDLAIADGGTGASTAADARTNLGLGTMATQDANNVNITGGTISGASFSGSISTNSISVSGNVTTGSYFIGNGSQLTGLPAGYSNADVATYLASNTDTQDIATSGTVRGGNVTTGGTVTAGAVSTGVVDMGSGWSITVIGGNLYLRYSGVNKAKLDTSGNFTVVGDVTAYGSI